MRVQRVFISCRAAAIPLKKHRANGLSQRWAQIPSWEVPSDCSTPLPSYTELLLNAAHALGRNIKFRHCPASDHQRSWCRSSVPRFLRKTPRDRPGLVQSINRHRSSRMYSSFTQRFTLLLLEEGEDYVSDYNAYCYAPGVLSDLGKPPVQIQESSFTLPAPSQRIHGKLRLCTKSIFFDADDASVPILRCAATALCVHRSGQPPEGLQCQPEHCPPGYHSPTL